VCFLTKYINGFSFNWHFNQKRHSHNYATWWSIFRYGKYLNSILFDSAVSGWIITATLYINFECTFCDMRVDYLTLEMCPIQLIRCQWCWSPWPKQGSRLWPRVKQHNSLPYDSFRDEDNNGDAIADDEQYESAGQVDHLEWSVSRRLAIHFQTFADLRLVHRHPNVHESSFPNVLRPMTSLR